MRMHRNHLTRRDVNFQNTHFFVFQEQFVMIGRGN